MIQLDEKDCKRADVERIKEKLSYLLFYLYFNKKNGNMIAYYRCIESKIGEVMSNKNTVQNAVYQELKKGIMTLHLVPGTEMSTQEIATKLQVSRTPVREAFIQLQKEGLVEAIPQKGTKVSPINIKRVGQERFLRESLELSVIEPFLANVNTQDYQFLRANIEKQKEYWNKRDFAGFVQLDNQFHKSLF